MPDSVFRPGFESVMRWLWFHNLGGTSHPRILHEFTNIVYMMREFVILFVDGDSRSSKNILPPHTLTRQSITNPRNGKQQPRVAGIVFYLLAQMPDMHFDRLLALHVWRKAPNSLHDL